MGFKLLFTRTNYSFSVAIALSLTANNHLNTCTTHSNAYEFLHLTTCSKITHGADAGLLPFFW